MARSKRDPGRRVGWSKLKKATRDRYLGAGVSREQWESGVDLRTARGHVPKAPSTAAPSEATLAAIQGQATEATDRALIAWQEGTAPSWIPKEMRFDVAAALSQLPNPSRWKEVAFIPRAGGEPWTMIVTPKNGYPISIEIPGGGAVGSGARDVLDLLTDPKSSGADMRFWKSWSEGNGVLHEWFEVMGSQ